MGIFAETFNDFKVMFRVILYFFLCLILFNACTSSQNTSKKTAIWSSKSKTTIQTKNQKISHEKTESGKTAVNNSKIPENYNSKKILAECCGKNTLLYKEISKWLGTPYRMGGCTTDGVDCSCFVIQIYKNVYGLDLTRTSVDMLQDVVQVSRENLKQGDILFFKAGKSRINHVGIFLKDDKFVHSSTSKGVTISSLEESYWAESYATAGRHKKAKENLPTE